MKIIRRAFERVTEGDPSFWQIEVEQDGAFYMFKFDHNPSLEEIERRVLKKMDPEAVWTRWERLHAEAVRRGEDALVINELERKLNKSWRSLRGQIPIIKKFEDDKRAIEDELEKSLIRGIDPPNN